MKTAQVYQTERFAKGLSLSYRLPVPSAGVYTVKTLRGLLQICRCEDIRFRHHRFCLKRECGRLCRCRRQLQLVGPDEHNHHDLRQSHHDHAHSRWSHTRRSAASSLKDACARAGGVCHPSRCRPQPRQGPRPRLFPNALLVLSGY